MERARASSMRRADNHTTGTKMRKSNKEREKKKVCTRERRERSNAHAYTHARPWGKGADPRGGQPFLSLEQRGVRESTRISAISRAITARYTCFTSRVEKFRRRRVRLSNGLRFARVRAGGRELFGFLINRWCCFEFNRSVGRRFFFIRYGNKDEVWILKLVLKKMSERIIDEVLKSSTLKKFGLNLKHVLRFDYILSRNQ